ncbi:MAG: hypothetical protein R3D56_05045 [Paracoccaceae bacterium]
MIGWFMGQSGPKGYFLFVALLFVMMALYSLWRMTQRAVRHGIARPLPDTGAGGSAKQQVELIEAAVVPEQGSGSPNGHKAADWRWCKPLRGFP